MWFKRITYKAELDPKKLFIIDGFGALLSSFLLGIVLVYFENIFGIPSPTLHTLASLAVLFAIYDLYCYQKRESMKLKCFLKAIAIINILYSCLTIGFIFYHSSRITIFGQLYILAEVLIIISLAVVEFKVANNLTVKIPSQ